VYQYQRKGHCEDEPDQHHGHCDQSHGDAHTIGMRAERGCRALPAGSQHIQWGKLERQLDPDRYHDDIVKEANDWDEIRNQLNGTKDVADSGQVDHLRIPRYSAITRDKQEHKYMVLELTHLLGSSLSCPAVQRV